MKRYFELPLTYLAIISVVTLCGCASPKWSHPSLTETDFNMARALCTNEANAAVPSTVVPYDPKLTPIQQSNAGMYNAGANIGRAFGVKSYFENCMFSRGFTKN